MSSKTVDIICDLIKYQCRPDKNEWECDTFYETLASYMGKNKRKSSNFIGGIGDNRSTLHENIFQLLHPYLEPQVHFGTGEGGLKKYLSKRFTADFVDYRRGIVYEIDGKSHENRIQKIKDKTREHFFYLEHGYKTVRYTNEEVELMLREEIEDLYRKGYFNSIIENMKKKQVAM